MRIQFVHGDYWKSKADSINISYRNIEAQRGNIYASDGSLLSTSLPIYELRMDMKTEFITDKIFNDNIDSISFLFSKTFPEKSSSQYRMELVKARKQGERFHLLQRDVNYSQYKEIKTWPIFRLGKYKSGLRAEKKSRRKKPFENLALRTLGYVMDGVQPVGIEGAFDKYLSGVSGKQLMQKISGNIWMPINSDNELEPKNGSDIITTIDINIQDVANNALKKQLIESDAVHGTAIVMDVSSAEIKAIANLTKTSNGDYEETYNYAIGGSTEPGSTFKLMSIMTGLEDGLINLTDSVDLEKGEHSYYDRTMRDSHDPEARKVTIKRAFEISSNVGISKALYKAYAKKPELFIDRINKMSLNRSIGLQIPGEIAPKIKNTHDKNWSGTSLPWMSIGYEINMTPLQILSFYNAVANNGKMVKPIFVKEIREHGKLIKSFSAEVINESIASSATLAKARELLEGVVENGTATNIRSTEYKIAGKTGTAQISDGKQSYHSDTVKYQASFVGYFPADNPKYSIIVVINSPNNGIYYGSATAAPVFKEIADKIYSTNLEIRRDSKLPPNQVLTASVPDTKSGDKNDLLQVCQDLGITIEANNMDAEWVYSRPSSKVKTLSLSEKKIRKGETPNVLGMGMRDAIFILENAGLQTRSFGRGSVIKQSPLPGSKLEKGKQVNIFLG